MLVTNNRLQNRVTTTNQLSSLKGALGSLVYCEDVGTHYVLLQGSYVADNNKVYQSGYGGNVYWIGIDGAHNYFSASSGREYINKTGTSNFIVTELHDQVYVWDVLTDTTTITLPTPSLALNGKHVYIFVINTDGYEFVVKHGSTELVNTGYPGFYTFVCNGTTYMNYWINPQNNAHVFRKIAINRNVPLHDFDFDGTEGKIYTIVTTNTAIGDTSSYYLFAPSANITVTLVPVQSGKIIEMVNRSGSYTVTINSMVDGATGYILRPYHTLRVMYDGTYDRWHTLSNNIFRSNANGYHLYSGTRLHIGGSLPTSKLHVEGAIATKVDFISSTTILSDTHSVVIVRPTIPSSIIVNLPQASTCVGRRYTIALDLSLAEGQCVITPYTGDTIATTFTNYTLRSHYQTITLVSNGSGIWLIEYKDVPAQTRATITSNSYTLEPKYVNKTLYFTSTSNINFYIPDNIFNLGDEITIIKDNTEFNMLTITCIGNTKINSTIIYRLSCTQQGSSITLRYVYNNFLVIVGQYGDWQVV